jgi:MFS family permease
MATPRLRGALALEFAVAAGGAMVLVNTVVLIRATFGLDDSAVALALASFGAGSILAALGLQRILSVLSDRSAMLFGAVLMLAGLATGPWLATFSALLPVWAVMGFGFSLSQMPIGRLLVRSAHPADRPALYAAQFALSHAGWLVAYPLAGWIGATYGLDAAFAAMTALGLGAFLVALVLWPADDPTLLDHRHDGLPADHPHWIEHRPMSGQHHRHAFVIDALHPRWPPAGRTNGLTGNPKN